MGANLSFINLDIVASIGVFCDLRTINLLLRSCKLINKLVNFQFYNDLTLARGKRNFVEEFVQPIIDNKQGSKFSKLLEWMVPSKRAE